MTWTTNANFGSRIFFPWKMVNNRLVKLKTGLPKLVSHCNWDSKGLEEVLVILAPEHCAVFSPGDTFPKEWVATARELLQKTQTTQTQRRVHAHPVLLMCKLKWLSLLYFLPTAAERSLVIKWLILNCDYNYFQCICLKICLFGISCVPKIQYLMLQKSEKFKMIQA